MSIRLKTAMTMTVKITMIMLFLLVMILIVLFSMFYNLLERILLILISGVLAQWLMFWNADHPVSGSKRAPYIKLLIIVV